ncbi:carboxyl-terminal processing protease [Bacteroidales bacterium WCE2004]|nr:carboxyl-terminal processing protease [Bacteroidales bacterium WCE2004]
MKRILLLIGLAGIALSAVAQTPRFKLGKWTEIQTAILQELNRSYVDSLPVDRIERRGIDAMLADLDPYTVYIPEEENENLQMMIHKTYGGIGAVIYKPDVQGPVIINEPYANSPAAKNGLVCGDEIYAIDGEPTAGLTSQQSSEKMRGEPGTQVTFHVKKLATGEMVDVVVTREMIKLGDIEYAGMLDSKFGYISQNGFTDGVGNEFRQKVAALKKQGMQALILDLRGNGGGLMNEAAEIVSAFVPKGSLVVSAQGRDPQANYVLRTTKDPVDVKLPVIVLVDSGSASASEIVAGALQDMDRATIMGERTFGKGLVQSIRSLPYGGELKVTTAKYYTPSGRCVQAIDYARRREDGSVASIPDSLTHEFKTAHGRTVRDGGGITPDVELTFREYSRLTYSLVTYGIIEQYALEFVRKHASIPAVEEFHLGQDDYEDFINFAKDKEFDYRSSAKTYFDRAKEELKRDGLDTAMQAELDALEKSLNMEKEDFLRLKQSEIVPFIEEEIVVRYYFQEAGVQIRIRYDDALRQAMASPLIKQY